MWQARSMKQTDFRDIPDELWKRIESFLLRSNEKSDGSKLSSQRTVLAGILYKCRTGYVNGPYFLRAMDQKALSTSTSSARTKPASWQRSSHPSYHWRNPARR